MEDILSSIGFLNGLKNCLRLQFKGLLCVGLPCNSHTFMSSSQHQRSYLQPHGCEHYGFVIDGNTIAYRAAIYILVALVRGGLWFLENPGGSKCICLPVLQHLLTFKNLGSTYMRWWGPQSRFHVQFSKIHVVQIYIYIYNNIYIYIYIFQGSSGHGLGGSDPMELGL